MSTYQCPQYSGQGAAAGRATCEFFAKVDAHPAEKWFGIFLCIVGIFFCLRYLRTGRVL
jgi:hypothetical protein